MRKNLILIGLPGSGKTTVGRLTAARLGLSFADCDTLMETAEGMTIPTIFDRKGEPYFRAAESRILADLCGGSGRVIATGGGAVVEEKNRIIIKKSFSANRKRIFVFFFGFFNEVFSENLRDYCTTTIGICKRF